MEVRSHAAFADALRWEGALLLEDVPPEHRGSVRVLEVWQGNGRRQVAVADWVQGEGLFPLHLAYLARLRRLLGAELGDWEVMLHEGVERSGLLPDALWYREGRVVPVEVDLGHYNDERLLRKLGYFASAYGYQVWGSLRERPLRLARALGVRGEFIPLEGKGERFRL